jgi:lipopolysaccharide export system protein LptA
MQWACDKLSVQLPAAGGQVQSIVAEDAVNFDLTDEKGQKIHGAGEKAVYSYGITATATNDVVELTGNPMLQTTNGVLSNSIIVLDRAHNKLFAPGKYRLVGLANTGVTNTFLLPQKHGPK